MRRPLASLAALVLGCATGPSSEAAIPPAATVQVVLDQQVLVLGLFGDSAVLHASTLDATGVATAAAVAWSSTDSSVAAVTTGGKVTSLRAGQAAITAMVGNVQATAQVIVTNRRENPACPQPAAPPVPGRPKGPPGLVQQAWASGPGTRYPAPEYVIADVDGDGRPDLVDFSYLPSSRPPVGEVRIWRNTAAGFVDASQLVTSLSAALDYTRVEVVADFNGDGREDVYAGQHGYDASPFPGAPNLLLLSQPGGTMEEVGSTHLHPDDANGFTHGAAAADVNCDGHIDIFESNLNGRPPSHLQLNDGTGNFTASDAGLPLDLRSGQSTFTAAAFCDLDRDGDQDLVLGGWPQTPTLDSLLVNDGHGHFRSAPPGILPAPHLGFMHTTTVDIACSDLNGDGWPDLVLSVVKDAYVAGAVVLWSNNADGTFTEVHAGAFPFEFPGAWVRSVKIADLNGDGWPDILVSGYGCPTKIFLNEGDFTFSPHEVPAAAACGFLAPLDADVDGRVDVVSLQYGVGALPVFFRNMGP